MADWDGHYDRRSPSQYDIMRQLEIIDKRIDALETSSRHRQSQMDDVVRVMSIAMGVDVTSATSLAARVAKNAETDAILRRAGRIGMAVITAVAVAVGVGILKLVAATPTFNG